MLIYSMREEADGILYSFGSSDSDRMKSKTVSKKSKTHFLNEKPYLRTKKFNIHKQEEGEPIDSFITLLALPASRALQL